MTDKNNPQLTTQLAQSDPELAEVIRVYYQNKLAPPAPPDVVDLPLTDAGNAETLAELNGNTLRYDHRRRNWLIWRLHRWERDNNGEIDRLALESVRVREKRAINISDQDKRTRIAKWALASENRGRLAAIVEIAKSIQPIANKGDAWDKNPLVLGCLNGVVDLKTGELRPGQPDDLITLSSTINYNPDATAPRFMQFLGEVFDNDPDLIEFIQRAVGYSLTGDIREHVLFLCWGKGANGKSTLLNAIRSALGEYATNTPFTTFELNQSNQTNDVAALEGKRFVTASETSEAKRMNEARVKAITGGDPVTARFLFGEWFTYQPTYKIWLAMNQKPTITGADDGIWRRIRLVPFTVSFKGREDKTLAQVLESEREGILAWAVQGAIKWLAGGLTEPRAVMAATEEYRKESDALGRFLSDCTLQQPGAEVKAGNLYKAYQAWCNENGEKEQNNTAFGRSLKERGQITYKRSGYTWYQGIALMAKED